MSDQQEIRTKLELELDDLTAWRRLVGSEYSPLNALAHALHAQYCGFDPQSFVRQAVEQAIENRVAAECEMLLDVEDWRDDR